MFRFAGVLAILFGTSTAGAAMVDVTVDSHTGPWSYANGGLNTAYQYGVGDQNGPTVVGGSGGFSFAAGGVFTIQYLSGSTSANVDTGFAFVDASGNHGYATNDQANGTTGTYFASRYVNQADYPVYLSELIGTFADDSGRIVGTPFAVGDLRSVIAPVGATRLELGINDEYYKDNAGSLLIRVTGPNLATASVPEPASAVLLCLGAMGSVVMAGRRMRGRAV